LLLIFIRRGPDVNPPAHGKSKRPRGGAIALASQTLAGCPDATVTAKPVDEKHLEGKGASGARIEFTRIK